MEHKGLHKIYSLWPISSGLIHGLNPWPWPALVLDRKTCLALWDWLREILKAIRTGVGFGSGTETRCVPHVCLFTHGCTSCHKIGDSMKMGTLGPHFPSKLGNPLGTLCLFHYMPFVWVSHKYVSHNHFSACFISTCPTKERKASGCLSRMENTLALTMLPPHSMYVASVQIAVNNFLSLPVWSKIFFPYSPKVWYFWFGCNIHFVLLNWLAHD